jgi:hypothetical protein
MDTDQETRFQACIQDLGMAKNGKNGLINQINFGKQ